MRRDSLLAAHDRAALDHAHSHVHVEGDVDPLADSVAEHVDRAVADDDPGEADVDAVELRSLHGHAVEDRVVDAVHCDPVRAADDGHVLDLDIVVRNDDAAADDGARLALEHLALPDHERTLVDACKKSRTTYVAAEPPNARTIATPETAPIRPSSPPSSA